MRNAFKIISFDITSISNILTISSSQVKVDIYELLVRIQKRGSYS